MATVGLVKGTSGQVLRSKEWRNIWMCLTILEVKVMRKIRVLLQVNLLKLWAFWDPHFASATNSTWCSYEVPGMIILHDLKGAIWLDCSKDTSVHVSTCTCYDFKALTSVVWKMWHW
jgi:hypothetical protein